MSMDEYDDSDESALPPSEAAREKRRDHDAEARTRAGMRTGLAKQFKQVLDTQRRRAEETDFPPRDRDRDRDRDRRKT
jgi:hypothetical protein